jgi:CPA2 family monovalent cation:H+ antiporter-2
LPQAWLSALASYSASAQGIARTTEWQALLKIYFTRIFFNAVIVSAIFLATAKFVPAYLGQFFSNTRVVDGLSLLLALLVSSPFLWAWILGQAAKAQVSKLWLTQHNRGPLFVLEAVRVGSAIGVFGLLAPLLVSAKTALAITMLWAFAVLFIFSRYWARVYGWIERRFMSNLSERETIESDQATPLLAPWDAHIAKLDVSPDSAVVGQSLAENKIRERFGVTIALIHRGRRFITAPTRNEVLYPGDQISVIGSDAQIAALQSFIEASPTVPATQLEAHRYSLHRVEVGQASGFIGHTIKDSGIRERTHGLVVGIEREGKRILNPDSTTVIESRDTLWVVGDPDRIKPIFDDRTCRDF